MANQEHINHVRRLFDEVFSGNDTRGMDEMIASNLKLRDPAAGNFKGGVNEFKELEKGYQKAFPDKRAVIDDIFQQGNRVIVMWTVTGTHKGELNGYKATQNKIRVSGISIYTFENGKIAEIDQVWDRLGLLEQIGEVHSRVLVGR